MLQKKFLLAVLVTSLLSFTGILGGDHFTIRINNDQLMEGFVGLKAPVQSLNLQKYADNDQVIITYSHCGQAGKNRHIVLKTAEDKVLQDWSFGDGKNISKGMAIKVKSIRDFQQKSGDNNLKLVYASTEIPNGYQLISLGMKRSNELAP